jgi:hypothetical protein
VHLEICISEIVRPLCSFLSLVRDGMPSSAPTDDWVGRVVELLNVPIGIFIISVTQPTHFIICCRHQTLISRPIDHSDTFFQFKAYDSLILKGLSTSNKQQESKCKIVRNAPAKKGN